MPSILYFPITCGILDENYGASVIGKVVADTKKITLHGFVVDNIQPGATVYANNAPVNNCLPNRHSVKHLLLEYVKDDCHINGVEFFWSNLKRAHRGTFHKISLDNLKKYVGEFIGRHNMRELDTPR